ncbi:MAG: glycosyltransferase [Nitrospirota bacterium]
MNPMVSVCMVTYNHEKFIAQAIESVLMQKTDFSFELVIGEDCSTDNTRKIVVEYKRRYPDKIKLLLAEKNLGAGRNFVQTIKACRGKYIALLEGDDYWTDNYKLQKQVDTLESNSAYVICFHNADVFYEDKTRKSHLHNNMNLRNELTIEDLFHGSNIICTSSCCFRNNLFEEFPQWYLEVAAGDWVLHVLNAQYGKLVFLPQTMSVYRVNAGSTWNSKNRLQRLKKSLSAREHINQHFSYKYNRAIGKVIAQWSIEVAKLEKKEGDLESANQFYQKALQALWSITPFPLALILKIYISYHFPYLERLFMFSERVARKI